jgi:hypothetical protein
MLLSNALTYLFKSTGSHPILKSRKTFHEISFIAPGAGCDPSSGFYKEEIHSGSNRTTNDKLFRE